MTLETLPTIPPIHPELYDRLMLATKELDFTHKSTLYDMGYTQAQRDFQRLLHYHLNKPLPEQLPTPAVDVVAKRWWQR